MAQKINSSQLSTQAVEAYVAASEGTSSTSSTDLTTVGPSVTITVPPSGKVLVMFQAQATVGASNIDIVASGANTVAYDQANSAYGGGAGVIFSHKLFTGLNPGSTTFKLQYHMDTGTGNFLRRRLTVIPQ